MVWYHMQSHSRPCPALHPSQPLPRLWVIPYISLGDSVWGQCLGTVPGDSAWRQCLGTYSSLGDSVWGQCLGTVPGDSAWGHMAVQGDSVWGQCLGTYGSLGGQSLVVYSSLVGGCLETASAWRRSGSCDYFLVYICLDHFLSPGRYSDSKLFPSVDKHLACISSILLQNFPVSLSHVLDPLVGCKYIPPLTYLPSWKTESNV